MNIGITGGTGCGKTTLLRLLEQAGFLVLDCDAIYHELLKTDLTMLSQIEARFPGTVTDGVLDRKKLGAIVFPDPQALADLNRITHKAIAGEVLRRMADAENVAIDAIALFESGLHHCCSLTVAVTAPTEARVRRLMARDGIPESYARSRIAAQPDNAWFRDKCQVVLENDGTAEDFQAKCVDFLRSIGIMEAYDAEGTPCG